MSARFIIGDVFDVLATLEPGSVDLVMSSPPFLALRSYLPSEHPMKAKEIGSEATPAAFIDTLLDVTEACARVLAPHGSLVFELGDSFSGSGGAGGDYADDGWRKGQPRWGGSASRARESQWSHADAVWLAGVLDTEGSVHVHRNKQPEGRASTYVTWVRVTMMDPQVCEKAAQITGVGFVTQDKRGAYTWACSAQQARFVLTHIWPYLLIKQRQAKAAIELSRHIDESERRGRHGRVTTDQIAYREMIAEYVTGLNARGEDRGKYVPTWEPPIPPTVRHLTHGGTGWPMPKSLALVPESYRMALAYGFNPFNGRQTDPWRVRNVVRWVRSNPPVGALGDKFRCATSDLVVACKARDRWFDLDAVRTAPSPNSPNSVRKALGNSRGGLSNDGSDGPRFTEAVASNPAGAPPLDWWSIPPTGYKGAHYATFSPELCRIPIEAMCPRRVCNMCNTPSRRIVRTIRETDGHYGEPHVMGRQSATGGGPFASNGTSTYETFGWSSCGCTGTDGIRLDGYHTGPGWRPGVVLDPFAGSGTTLLVATGHGRDAIGIDLDERNADLARERVGMWLDVEHHKAAA